MMRAPDTLFFKTLHEGVVLPQYETPDTAGMDIRADIDKTFIIQPSETQQIRTGLAMASPPTLRGTGGFGSTGRS